MLTNGVQIDFDYKKFMDDLEIDPEEIVDDYTFPEFIANKIFKGATELNDNIMIITLIDE